MTDVPQPFLKWVGGKRRSLPALRSLLPAGIEMMRHVEPFLGGGAVFFAQRPVCAVLSDLNADLITTYRVVRDEPDVLLTALEGLATAHSPAAYYAARERFNARATTSPLERAALFVYLNKTCFNGLYRVNRSGDFNAPAGRYNRPNIVDIPRVQAAARALSGVDLRCAPFEAVLEHVGAGDFVYLDPPYVPLSATSSFVAYGPAGFSCDDQRRLALWCRILDRRGAKLMLSNADTPWVRELYRGLHIECVAAPRAINCRADKRGAVNELVIRNYDSVSEVAHELAS